MRGNITPPQETQILEGLKRTKGSLPASTLSSSPLLPAPISLNRTDRQETVTHWLPLDISHHMLRLGLSARHTHTHTVPVLRVRSLKGETNTQEMKEHD